MSDMPIQDVATENDPKKIISSFGAFASSMLAVIALIGLAMTLAGYGVAMAVETQFGIPHATIFKSGFDLLSLSVWFMMWILNNSFADLKTIFFNPLYWKSAGWLASFGMVGCILGLTAATLKGRLAKVDLVRRLSFFKRTNKLIPAAFITLLIGLGSAAISLIGWPLLLWAGLTLSAVIGTIPAISLGAGESHIKEYVIKPVRCMRVSTRSERLKSLEETEIKHTQREKLATCVKLFEGEKIIASGRVVFSTTELIVLYNPKTGDVTRESLDGRSVRIASEL